jgi:8-oxo-dGTP diphosphatase
VRLVPVALALFYRQSDAEILEVWTQVRTDDGVYHGLLEFPGGGIEANETPLEAVIREVEEEVGIKVSPHEGKFMGTYVNDLPGRSILLYVHLFSPPRALEGKGQWLSVTKEQLSSPYQGKIPGPNHQIIDDLYRYLYDVRQL